MAYLNPHSTLGELDLYLIGKGCHEKLWEVLGAHIKRAKSGKLLGTIFTLWAPNAQAVSLICDANFWDRNSHKMKRVGRSGIWEIFIPDLGAGLRYKFAIQQGDGRWVDHADPLAHHTEIPPLTASVLFESQFQWSDTDWIAKREKFESWRRPVSIYEVHLGSWKLGLNYRQLGK